jgi:uncharacterized membrane protein YcaP (DUF421 family)
MGKCFKRTGMNKNIDIFDFKRMLFGETPYEFMIEVIIRILFVYILLVIAMRIMGPRLAARITRNEQMALVTLSAGVGVAILTPERGLLPPVVVVIVVISVQYLIARITRKSKTADRIILDKIAPLIKDGEFQLDIMKQTRITRERVMAQLRIGEIKNLGIVQRMFMEANGKFSIVTFQNSKDRPGLCTIPPKDGDFRKELHFVDDTLACTNCGHAEEKKKANKPCSTCGKKDWEEAVLEE